MMNGVKKTVLLMLTVCLLAGLPAVSVSAAACDHDAPYFKQNTGQYKNSSYDHLVAIGKYADGTPIKIWCHVTVKSELWLIHCRICHRYIATGERNSVEGHHVVHN